MPYEDMWESDKLWLPMVLDGKLVKGKVDSDNENSMRKIDVITVESLA